MWERLGRWWSTCRVAFGGVEHAAYKDRTSELTGLYQELAATRQQAYEDLAATMVAGDKARLAAQSIQYELESIVARLAAQVIVPALEPPYEPYRWYVELWEMTERPALVLPRWAYVAVWCCLQHPIFTEYHPGQEAMDTFLAHNFECPAEGTRWDEIEDARGSDRNANPWHSGLVMTWHGTPVHLEKEHRDV